MPEEKKTTRENLFLVHPNHVDTPEAKEKFVDGVTDAVLDLIDEERKKNGLPPMTD